ncbi:MAG: hypothetical protein ACC658_13945 [Acidimicrobiia bacterium]
MADLARKRDTAAGLLERAGEAVLDAVIDALDDTEQIPASPTLDPTLWGEEPSRADAVAAEVWASSEMESARASLLGECETREGAADTIGVTAASISNWVDEGDLVALRDGRELRIPKWQIDLDQPRGIVTGIKSVAAAFPSGVVSLSAWVRTPNVNLSNATPLQRMKTGDVDRVVRVAGSIGTW